MSSPELTSTERELLRRQVLAMQAQLDALLAVLGDAEACSHPDGQRRYETGGTMGSTRRYVCGVCEALVTEPRPEAA